MLLRLLLLLVYDNAQLETRPSSLIATIKVTDDDSNDDNDDDV